MRRMFANVSSRICPRHVPGAAVLCGEGTAGKLADTPGPHIRPCGNPILGHIEINGRAVVEVSAASHGVSYLS